MTEEIRNDDTLQEGTGAVADVENALAAEVSVKSSGGGIRLS